MNRVSLGDGKWFDLDKAVKLEEGKWFDGRNRISRATGSQWLHESLYYTRKGNWVINRWSQVQGDRETYALISLSEVGNWVIAQEMDDDKLAGLPEPVRLSLLEGMKGQEV
jgi:hypothetical protein